MELKYLLAFDNMESWYFEVTNNRTVLRQIVIEANGNYIASNRKHEEHHFFLTDQEVDFDNPDYIQITKTVFDKVWSSYSDTLRNDWNRTKDTLSIGTEVTGYIEVFYPQGVLVNIFKNNAVGVADYIECKESTTPEWLYPNNIIKAKVKGFDEDNLWIILENSKVLDVKHT